MESSANDASCRRTRSVAPAIAGPPRYAPIPPEQEPIPPA